MHFVQVMQENRVADPVFHRKIFFTDELCFTRRGITDAQKGHVFSDENLHIIKEKQF